MSDADQQAFDAYDQPENREPAPGPARRLAQTRPGLTEYVPIRLNAEAMAAVRDRAHQEGLTVSAWVRRLIERELNVVDEEPSAAVEKAIQTLEGVRRSLSQGGWAVKSASSGRFVSDSVPRRRSKKAPQ